MTSSDDELDLSRADSNFNINSVREHISRYERLGQYFHLANGGNAINFIRNAEVGPYIYLVQGEVVAAIDFLCEHRLSHRINELPTKQRRDLATRWLARFG